MPKHPSITKKRFLKDAQVFHFFTRTQAVRFYKGHDRRDKRIETLLPEFVSKRKLRSVWENGKKIYSVPRKGRRNLYHGLSCTECLIRIWRAKPQGEIYPEKDFKTYPMVPEWAIRYPSRKLLLFEFCTRDNFERRGNVEGKIRRYMENLPAIDDEYQTEAIVLFVLDVPRNKIEKLVEKIIPEGEQFFFVDYRTFLTVHPNEQLTAPIYIWGVDGESYPLSR